MHTNFKGQYVIAKHTITGIIIFYFLIHPLTMVIYWFEFSNVEMTSSLFLDVIAQRLNDSFSLHMMGMSSIFIIIGGLVGLSSGLYYKKILQKNKALKLQEEQLERNIELIIHSGESDIVEFKSSLRYDYANERINKGLEKVFLKIVTGFLNAKGGTLLIGVDDNGVALGLEKDYATLRRQNRDGFELKLMQLISSQIGTEFCSFIRVSFYKLSVKDICSIEVIASSVPAYVNIDGKTIFYLRTGNSTKQLTVQEAVNYVSFRK
jgi:schlafen family protein